MHQVHCYHCGSKDVEYHSDIKVGCCEHKTGEVWHCNQCAKDMVIQVVFSEDQIEVDCPHDKEHSHQCGGCADCQKSC